jgi:hypothetical protein
VNTGSNCVAQFNVMYNSGGQAVRSPGHNAPDPKIWAGPAGAPLIVIFYVTSHRQTRMVGVNTSIYLNHTYCAKVQYTTRETLDFGQVQVCACPSLLIMLTSWIHSFRISPGTSLQRPLPLVLFRKRLCSTPIFCKGGVGYACRLRW